LRSFNISSMIQLILILEDENTKYIYECGSTNDLEEVLLSKNLKQYCYKNILFYVDNDLNIEMSKIYKKRYF